MRFRGLLFPLIFLPFILWANPSNIPVELDSLVLDGKRLLYDLQFKEAEKTFAQIERDFPDYPHGFVFRAYLSAMYFGLDESNEDLGKRLKSEIDIALDKSRTYKSQYPEKTDGYFYIAISSGIDALYHVIERNFLSAYWSGRRAKKNLETVVEMDSTYYDAYIGLGMFHYYADLLPGVLKFFAGLVGFDGDRIKGKREIRLSGDKGHYFKAEGDFIYHGISYFLEGETGRGLAGFRRLYRAFPGNNGFGLLIAYHYRKSGKPQKCIQYCQELKVDEDFTIPQITNMKFYNMAVSFFNMNAFAKSDSMFNLLEQLPTRKSRFYQGAISYYRGYLADLRFERRLATAYYNRIKDTKKMRYWYLLSRAKLNYPADSLTIAYQKAYNLLLSHQLNKALSTASALRMEMDRNGKQSANPDFGTAVDELLGYIHYFKRDYKTAKQIYDQAYPRILKMRDPFERAWALMHYQRCLRQSGDYDKAEEILDKIDDIDENYTKLIVEKERFILNKKRRQNS